MFSKAKTEVEIFEKKEKGSIINYLGFLKTPRKVYGINIFSNNCIANRIKIFKKDYEVTFYRYNSGSNMSFVSSPGKMTSALINSKLDNTYPEIYLRSEESFRTKKPIKLNKKYNRNLEKLISKYI